jgi:hypothetical protein
VNATRISVLLLLLAMAGSVQAQTATPVVITIDTNVIFSSANSWIENFISIFAISIGVALAIAVLTFLYYQLSRAFGGRFG